MGEGRDERKKDGFAGATLRAVGGILRGSGRPTRKDSGRTSQFGEARVRIPEPGTIIDGKYRVADVVGEGGMGVVLRARDEQLERDVAIKLIRPLSSAQSMLREQFLLEARTMAKVRHQNVVEIYAFGDLDGMPYFVMEYIEGPTLQDWFDQRGGPPLAVDEALGFLEQICRGVEAIHAAGAVHRDLKPNNVLIGPAFRIAVADLGLAQAVDRRVTGMSSSWGGTPVFMAPEVAGLWDVASDLAHRADIYALGVMAFELLTGRVPFDGELPDDILRRHITEPPPVPSQVRPELAAAFDAPILDALVKDPARRTATARDFRDQLMDARARITLEGSRARRIAIVDDDPDFIDLIATCLRHEIGGCQIDAYRDGATAYTAIVANPPDIVMLDLKMPGLDGVQLTEALRSSPATKDLPIIVLTAFGGAPDWQLLRQLGADAFQVKPVDLIAVLAIVRRLIDRQAARAAHPSARLDRA